MLLASFASYEAVLRTAFASQIARGAIVFGALASELADAPYIDYTIFTVFNELQKLPKSLSKLTLAVFCFSRA